MAEYRQSGHALCDSKYHLVWITKYRYKIPRGEVAEHARDLIRQICHARELAQYIKGRSSRRLQEEFPSLRKRYWGQHSWARGYCCATVGAVDEETMQAYSENQKWDLDDQGFQITAPGSRL